MDSEQLETLSTEVARELAATGVRWQSSEGATSAIRALTRGDSARLTMTDDCGRVRVAGWYPATSVANLEYFKINVSADRGAAAIAAEIRRRLLPGYLPELDRVLAHNRKREQQHEQRGEILAGLAELLGGTYRHPEYSVRADSAKLLMSQVPGNVGGDVTITGEPSTVDMTLRNVPAGIAQVMLTYLAQATR